MTEMTCDPALDGLSGGQRAQAMARFAILQPHIDAQASLDLAARKAGIARRTAERWLSRYKDFGIAGLARTSRADSGVRKIHADLLRLIEGSALGDSTSTITAIHRHVEKIARERGLAAPSYASVHAIVRALDSPRSLRARETLAVPSLGVDAKVEMVLSAKSPNALWRACRAQLNIWVLGPEGLPARPMLTAILDDYSGAVAGFSVYFGPPSAERTSLVLRQAIWRKSKPAWPICGLPTAFAVDHGGEAATRHFEHAGAALKISIVCPTNQTSDQQTDIEEFFRRLDDDCLSQWPAHSQGSPSDSAEKMTLTDLEAALLVFIVQDYNARPYDPTGRTRNSAWREHHLPLRMPASLLDLDLLLFGDESEYVVGENGIHFQGARYFEPVLAAFVGDRVTVRYDPTDLFDIRLFHQGRFLCRATR
jgi:putative transposase